MRIATLVVCCYLALVGTLGAQTRIALQSYVSGLRQPVDITHAGDSRLFVIEKAGRIRIIDAEGTLLSDPFLDIVDRVGSTGGEQGLLGLAFHPNYANNGLFFVNYTNRTGDTRISRFRVSSNNANRADPASERIMITIEQPFSNHNGGDLAFGPDGYLYIAMGDGGSGGDPNNFAQNRTSLLGKMLRIDVDRGDPYAIPPDNPFAAAGDGVLDEIWALGLRNPWRFSFDRLTGAMWIGDVGQDKFEEINYQEPNSPGGRNYGWRCYEGPDPYNNSGCPQPSNLTFPIRAYAHGSTGCRSVTGGFVYRGQRFPSLRGYYLYADYCTGQIWGLFPAVEGGFTNVELLDFNNNDLVSFGEGRDGELYAAGLSSGNIYRVVDRCAALEPPVIVRNNGILSVPDTFATYQWYRGDEAVGGATSATYQPAQTGSFRVEVSDSRGCRVTSEPFLLTAVEEPVGVRWWQASPNPFRDELRLEIELTEPAVFQVKIYDAGGRLVHQDLLPRSRRWLKVYNLRELDPGLYFLSLEGGRQRLVQKLLKTK